MISHFLVLALGVLFLGGCATAGKNYALELQQCQSRISFLEMELNDKEREIDGLAYDLQQKESASCRGAGASAEAKDRSISSAEPSAIQIQKALKNAGYYHGPIDGKIGMKTQEAIKRFQKDNGLKVDGKVGRMTWSELEFYLD